MSRETSPHAGNLRKGRYSETWALYLVTKCTERPYELSCGQRDHLIDAFRGACTKGILLLHAFIVMPDHWHALLSLGDSMSLGKVVRHLSLRASFRSRQAGGGVPWQREYHDHRVRPMESVTDIVRYVEENPVRKGLVSEAAAWRWSSAYPANRDMLGRTFLGHERWEQR